MIEIDGKLITGECQYCGDAYRCQLLRDGYGIGRIRNNVMKLVKCQLDHKERRLADEAR